MNTRLSKRALGLAIADKALDVMRDDRRRAKKPALPRGPRHINFRTGDLVGSDAIERETSIATFADTLAALPQRVLDTERDRVWALVSELATEPDGPRETVTTFLPAFELRVIRLRRISWVLTLLPASADW